ncbi:head-tail connector protein [Paracoccus versutus]|uniref:Putative phiE125 gp8 family phage protein n=1 Tax=Paracoccus versutus TaxID=34007 RepID=A0A3D9XGL3_PARVE|nr:hypothetical protein [Paracoccus versutus]REF69645.1 putative phiE125 gp8 family phage protein [Paracoccus versutus]
MRIERSGEGLNILPVDIDQIEVHFSMLGAEDIEGVTPYILAAAREIEDFAGLALIRQTITLRNVRFDVRRSSTWWSGVRQGIPETAREMGVRPLFLPVRPATELVSIAHADDGTLLALDGFRIYGVDDPELQPRGAVPTGSLDVAYTAGYGDDPAPVPADLRLAVLDHALRLYERRGDETATPAGLSAAAARIVGRYRRVHL